MASIRERTSESNGTTWAVLYRLNGKQTSGTFTTLKAAQDFKVLCDVLGPKRALETVAAEQADGLTLDHLADRFFEWKAAGVTGRTIADYRRDYANWIQPALGHRLADSIDELDVQTLVDRMATRLDPKSVADRHAILSGAFRYGTAKSRKLVTQNPCLETQLPRRKKKRPKGFSLSQWEAMHEWARKSEPDADDLLLFIASTGWRFSECTPLTPAAVEDHGGAELHDGLVIPVVFVSVLGVHRRDEDDRIVYAEGEAKSDAGLRRINLPPEAAQMVRRRLVGKGPGDLLFTSPDGGQWRSSNFLEREFARILAGAGIAKVKGMGPHYLRHTHVAMLDRAGVSPAKTQRRIGHGHLATTFDVYGGMIGNALTNEELARLGVLISQPQAAGEVIAGTVVAELPSPAGSE